MKRSYFKFSTFILLIASVALLIVFLNTPATTAQLGGGYVLMCGEQMSETIIGYSGLLSQFGESCAGTYEECLIALNNCVNGVPFSNVIQEAEEAAEEDCNDQGYEAASAPVSCVGECGADVTAPNCVSDFHGEDCLFVDPHLAYVAPGAWICKVQASCVAQGTVVRSCGQEVIG